MTLIVGILCSDGVVMASDSAATFGADGLPTIGQQEAQKVKRINEHVLFSSTGAVGMGQLISHTVKDLWDRNKLKTSADGVMAVIGKAINELVEPYLQTGVHQRAIVGTASASLCKTLIALPTADKKPQLFQFDYNGAPERATPQLPFVALGSGQPIADPFLAFLKRLVWQDSQPTVAEGRLVAIWTIAHVSVTNPGGVGGGIQLATLAATNDTPKVIEASKDQIEEHLQRIASAEEALVKELKGKGIPAADPPAVPTAPQAPTSSKQAG